MENNNQTNNKKDLVKNIYLYLVSFVTLMILIINTSLLLNLGLKTYIFTKADNYKYYSPNFCENIELKNVGENRKITDEECAKKREENKKMEEENRIANRQREAVQTISFIAIALPLFLLHWRAVRKKDV